MSPLANALLITGAFLFGSVGLGQAAGFDPMWLMIIATAIWAGWDASRIQLGKYKTGLSSPVVVFIGGLVLWIVAFPWYLVVRQKIAAGQVPLKDGTMPAAAIAVPAASSGAAAARTSAVLSDSKTCPKCAETIKVAAQVCRYCGHNF